MAKWKTWKSMEGSLRPDGRRIAMEWSRRLAPPAMEMVLVQMISA